MTAPSTVCPSCGEDVPFGRRTCEACGANVTAAAAPGDAVSDGGAEPPDAGDESPDLAEVAEATSPTTDDAGWDAAPAEAAAEPGPAEPEAAPPAEVEPEPAPFVPPVLREWTAGSLTPETGFAGELAAAQAEPAGVAGAWLPPSSPATRTPIPDSPAAQHEPPEWPVAAPDSLGAPPPDAARTPPNAMPASLAAMLERTSTGTARWPGAAERTDAGLGPSTAAGEPTAATVPPSRMPDLGPAAQPSTALPPEARRLEPGRAPLFADLPFDAPDTLPGWLVAGGGGLATVSFLLPWIDRPDSYFSAWGLAAISNLPVFLVAFGTTALAILPSRLADWLRHGILGLAVGSFILGIVWNRIVGSPGSQLGVVLEATGALLLLIGGILAIVRDRGAAEGPRERG